MEGCSVKIKSDVELVASKNLMVLIGFVCMHISVCHGSDQWPPSRCDDEWNHCRAYIAPRTLEETEWQRKLAEAGNVDAQYFLGIVSTDDADKRRWLKMAIANGSKEAAAYFAYNLDERWKTEPFTPELHAELLQPIIDAAKAEDPRAATWLMEMARGQRKHCSWLRFNCPKSPLIRLEDTRKWAEIAARGGNMGAAEFICVKQTTAFGFGGFTKDDDKAYFWCQIAAPQTCATSAKLYLAQLYRENRIPNHAPQLPAGYWTKRFRQDFDEQTKRILPYHIGACS